MRAAVFVRYHSGDEMGHVAWCFDVSGDATSNSGSVENHTGRFVSASQNDGFWTQFSRNPVALMRKREYDDAKFFDLPHGDAVTAYRVVLWIKERGYRALFRNCEDDAYDVLRAYGVQNLPAPAMHWLPRRWFGLLGGTKVPVDEFDWQDGRATKTAENSNDVDFHALTPLHPTWRRPLHPNFHVLNARKLFAMLPGRS